MGSAAALNRGGTVMAHVQASGAGPGPAAQPPAVQPANGLVASQDEQARASGRHRQQPEIVLDAVSRHIIEQLQQDGRRSYAAIGKAVRLSEAAVRQRVQRLIDVGAMQIVAVTDPMSLGFRRQTMIGIRCTSDLQRVADLLAGMEAIDYVVITAGSFDLLIEVVCEDDDQLLEILGQVRSLPGVTMTETFVYLKLRKQTYHWGTR
jgi:Lrp/AsnC family transcriptional regulator for asnA, asnC and gidA